LSNEPAREIRAIFKHGGELKDIENLPSLTHSRLKVEYIVFSGQLKANHDGYHERKKNDHRDKGKQDIEETRHYILPSRNLPVSLFLNPG
jgi:hypothetical protein